ncbi:MAG: methyltransferase domain-containing protein [Legionellales bacterium]|nr:methyltransferase domain-containing protein [Legionellales bacterium]
MNKFNKLRNFLLLLIISINPCFSELQANTQELMHTHTTRPKGTSAYTCSLCGKIHDNVNHPKKDKCSVCNKPGRQRTLPFLVSDIIPKYTDKELAQTKALLAFAPGGVEQDYLKKYFKTLKVVTLYGNYSSDSEIGVDARDLSRYPDESFSGVYAMGTYDFFTEQEQAIREAYRVIAPGGIFMILFLPYRLINDDSPPRIGYTTHSTDTYMPSIPRDREIVSVKLGKKWYVEAMNRAGFKGYAIDIYDEIREETYTWFIGEKSKSIN